MDTLQGFSLPSDAMWEMRRVLDKRVKTPFSRGLSTEGQQAMTLAREDSKLALNKEDSIDGEMPQPSVRVVVNGTNSPLPKSEKQTSNKDKSKSKDRKQSAKSKRQISFAEKFNKNSAPRLEGDITDENFTETSQKKRAIGGKVESAMETIEIVNRDEDPPSEEHDGAVVEETAKLNSVEKCRVWMEVNEMDDKQAETASTAPTPLPTPAAEA